MSEPIDELAALKARRKLEQESAQKPGVGVKRVGKAGLCLYFRDGTRSVVVPVTLETAEEHAGDILRVVKDMRER